MAPEGRTAADLADSAFGVGVPECVELKTLDADEAAGLDGVERESVSNRCCGDQEIHGACSFASSGAS